MFDFAPRAMLDSAYPDATVLTERLSRFAEEVEALGLPWAAAHIRNVAGMVTAERSMANAMRE